MDGSLFWIGVFLAALSASPVWAHGGAGIDIDPCAQKVGPYYIHFTAYQPQTDPSGEYCEDVPKAGNTILVFDLVDQELRGKPLAIRVIEAANTPEPRTVLEVAAKTYPNGVVNAEANFDTPGTYLAIVTLKGPENTVSFPIRVEMWSATLVPLFGLLVMGSALYYFIGRQKGWPLPFRGTKAQPKLRLVKSSSDGPAKSGEKLARQLGSGYGEDATVGAVARSESFCRGRKRRTVVP
jgi:hypothetical protein